MKFTISCETKNDDHLYPLQMWGKENGYLVNTNLRYSIKFAKFTGAAFAAVDLNEELSQSLQSHLRDADINCRADRQNVLRRFLGTLKIGHWLTRFNVGFMFLGWLGSIALLIHGMSGGESLFIPGVALAVTTGWFLIAFALLSFIPTILVPVEKGLSEIVRNETT